MFTLRHYQEDAVVSLFDYFYTHATGNPIVALPTGTGKSIVIAEFIRRSLHLYPQTRILNLTHVKELVDQNHKELVALWPSAPAGIYSAGLKRRDTHLPITFCGIASVAKRVEDFGHIDLVIIDECHLVSDKNDTLYAKAIGSLMAVNPRLRVIGLTATPYRLGTGLLTEGKVFTDVCCDWTTLEKFNQLVDEGYIAPLIPKRTKHELDTTGVGTSHGEFNIDELQAAVDVDSVTRGALTEAVTEAQRRVSWLVFCSGTKHADHTSEILTQLGVSNVRVHSDLEGGDAERDQNIKLFKGGHVQAMVGVGVFTTGFNHPPVDCIVILRPTMSAGLWVQMLGRGTRPCGLWGKENCLVLDFAANTRRLGPINDPVIPKKRGKGKGEAPFKVCPQCDTYNHARARTCVLCGYIFPAVVATSTTAATDELIRKQREPAEVPVLTTFDVTRVEYSKHTSRDVSKPPSLLVTYYCGLRIFNEWLCLEHTGFARHKARDAWRMMAGAAAEGEDPGEPPDTIKEALELVDYLRPPSKIRVLVKSKWPEVVGYEFTENVPQVGDDYSKARTLKDIHEDDIPF